MENTPTLSNTIYQLQSVLRRIKCHSLKSNDQYELGKLGRMALKIVSQINLESINAQDYVLLRCKIFKRKVANTLGQEVKTYEENRNKSHISSAKKYLHKDIDEFVILAKDLKMANFQP